MHLPAGLRRAIALGAVGVILAGCAGSSKSPAYTIPASAFGSSSTSREPLHMAMVTYRVTGSASGLVNVSYYGPNGISTHQVLLPWSSAPFLKPGPSSFLTVNANWVGDSSATVRCEILVADTVVASNSSSGQYGFVSCEDS